MKYKKLETQKELDKALELAEREGRRILLTEPITDDIPERFEKVYKKINKLQEKYCGLTWYSRKDYLELILESRFDVIESMRKMEKKYPEEIKEMSHPEYGEWQCAFNCGVLATLRLVSGLMDKNFEELDEFPPYLEEAQAMDLVLNKDGIIGHIYEGWDDAIDNFPELDT